MANLFEDAADEERRLIEKLAKIEALFARPATAGERAAAESARDRIRTRLLLLEKTERPIEYRFTLSDGWSRRLFIALLRRYGLRPYRYRRQRHTTVMVRVTETFTNEVLWPEFRELDATLRAHLQAVTDRIVSRAIHGDGDEVDEQEGEPERLAQQMVIE